MLNLMTVPYFPDAEEMTILEMFHDGKTQKEIAEHFNVTHECMRQRVCQLRAKLGALTNEQMMSHYGMYKERKKK